MTALGIGGCTYFVYRAVTGPVDATNDFFAAAVDGDEVRARELLDPRCFDDAEIDGLLRDLATANVEGYEFLSTSVVDDTAEVSGTVTIDGDAIATTVDLNNNEDGWQICGFDVDTN